MSEVQVECRKRYQDYIHFLRENFGNLIKYKEAAGTLQPELVKIRKDLFDADPFVVFNASIAAKAAFSDKNIYH